MKGIILHGGRGTRLHPLTYTRPKQLLPIANKPISQYALDDLIEAGIRDIAILVSDTFSDKVKNSYGDGTNFGVKITYIHQEKPRGIAHAIQSCKDFINNDEKFIVYLGDNVLGDGITHYLSRFVQSDCDALVLLCKVNDPSRFGIATIREKYVERIVEKPKNSLSNLAVIGVYFLKSTIFKIIGNLKPSWRGELEITEALQGLIDSGGKVRCENIKGWWKDAGTPEDILDTNRLILDSCLDTEIYGIIDSKCSLQGRIAVGNNTKVSKGSIVRGPVILGENSHIGSAVYIGPFTSIGNNVHLMRSKIENSIVMDNCIIDTPIRITDSIISNDSTITTLPSSNPSLTRRKKFLLGESSKVFV